MIRNFDLGVSKITKLFVFFDTVRSKKINQVVQENIGKDLSVQEYESEICACVRTLHVHTYIYKHTSLSQLV